jgi:hypothetical protein
MNTGGLDVAELRRRALLEQIQTAEVNLLAGLHQHDMEAVVRAHLERALAHIREAYIAVNEQTRVRTVQKMADQLSRVEQMQADLRAQQTIADPASPSIHV